MATFPVDHIIPTAFQGKTEPANLALACSRCNATKWMHSESVDPLSGEMTRLFNPRTDVWAEHFRWSEADPAVIEALTQIGRATVTLLSLNSSQHVKIRHWLIRLGIGPAS